MKRLPKMSVCLGGDGVLACFVTSPGGKWVNRPIRKSFKPLCQLIDWFYLSVKENTYIYIQYKEYNS